ncbi:MAG: MBL fold metallo-hydrolase [Deltaproteobacteria bacterium]|nr:MBL fold metallo-hydrolase [Deltaproteobacteria bacterium]
MGPCAAVLAGGEAYLFDAGAGLVRRAAEAYAAGHEELQPKRLARVFLTHLHSDHTLGFPDLILTPWVLGRERALEAYGPPGLQAMTDHLLAAWAEDIDVRIHGAEGNSPEGVRVEVHEIPAGHVYRDARVTITAFAVEHGTWPHSYGYRIEAGERTIVISGDTTKSQAVVRACDGCDVLVHEVYAVAGFAELPPDWQGYHGSFHTSTADLARVAQEARPGMLVLVHPLLWKDRKNEQVLVDEVRRGWSGRVVLGRDLDVY